MVSVNGKTLESMGIGYSAVDGWADGPRESRDTLDLPGQFGQIESGVETVSPRTITIRGAIRGPTVDDRIAVLEAAVAHMSGLVEITPSDHPLRTVLGRLERNRSEGVHGILNFDRDVLNVRLNFTCHDPRYRDINAQVISFDSTPRPVPMGTAPHKGIIRVAGQPTDPTITVRDFRGMVVASLELDGTLAADEAWIIDLRRDRITLSDAGVESADDDELVSGYFWAFDPRWANHVYGAWPTIEIDSGSGDLTYFRRWTI